MPVSKKNSPIPKIPEKFNFSSYLTKYEARFYTNNKGQTEIPVAVQYIILTEACKDWKLTFSTEIISSQITPLYHSIVVRVSITDLQGNVLKFADGISTKYAYDYVALAAKSASEVADTVATGRALAKLGINKDGKFSTQEEMDVFRQTSKKPLDDAIRQAAALFAECPSNIKKMCDMNNINIPDLISLVGPSKGNAVEFAKLIENHIVGMNGERKI